MNRDVLIFGGFVVVWAFATLFCIVRAVREWRLMNRIKTDGVPVEGKISGEQVQQFRGSDGDISREYFVTVTYSYDGKPFKHKQRLSRRHFNRMAKGQSVEMLCLPDDPASARLAGADADNSNFNRLAILALGSLAAFVAFVAILAENVRMIPR